MQKLRRQQPQTGLQMLLHVTFTILIFLQCIATSRAQQLINSCPLRMIVYESQSHCENDRDNPAAEAVLYATDTCLNHDVVYTDYNSLLSDLPGNYQLECQNDGSVRFHHSGCLNDDCSGTSQVRNNICRNDVSTMSAYFALLTPPVFELQPPNARTWFCYTVTGSGAGSSVTFAILGSCEECIDETPFVEGVAPTPRPTLRVTPEPTVMPTFTPTVEPTRAPVRAPTRVPTGRPTLAPTRLPTETPTSFPTERPTLRPTARPSLIPTIAPTNDPTTKPLTPRPTVLSSHPSSSPTIVPTSNPTAVTDSPTVTEVQVTVTSAPTAVVTNPPTFASAVPTEKGVPSVSPVVLTVPSQTPSENINVVTKSPTVSDSALLPAVTDRPTTEQFRITKTGFNATTTNTERTAVVSLEFYLLNMPSLLSVDERSMWESVTSNYIRRALERRGDLKRVTLAVHLLDQAFMETAAFDNFAYDDGGQRRHLQDNGSDGTGSTLLSQSTSQSSKPLRIESTAEVAYTPNDEFYSGATSSEMVNGAFDSSNERATYLIRLYATNSPIYDDLREFRVVVDGQIPVESEAPITQDDGGMNIGIVAGAAVAGAIVLALIGFIIILSRKKNHNESTVSKMQPNTEKSSDSRPILAMPYRSEIVVDTAHDEVSTLGDTFQQGLHFASGQVEDEHTASIQPDYDVLRQQYKQQRSITELTSGTQGNNTTSEGALPLPLSVFSDDQSFEQQFDANGLESGVMIGDSNRNILENGLRRIHFDVIAPPGLLGMVLDTPQNSCPVVYAIKDDSPLADRVQVGDQLVSVDDIDVSRMKALEVSRLIAQKATAKRLMNFVRIQEP